MSIIRNSLLLALCLCAATQVSAQASHAGRWFQVEVIVFAQTSPGSSGRDLPLVETLSRPDNLQFLRTVGDAARGSADLERDPMVLLPRAQRTMNHLAKKLDGAGGYRVLYHGAWRQPVLLRRDAQPIYIRGGGQVHDTPELEGTLVPSVDFYLATEVDLRLSEPGEGMATRPLDASSGPDDSDWHRQAARMEPDIDGLARRGGYGQAAERPATATIALQEKRGRMRSTELHYFDHPRMGMLIRYDRYSAPPVAVDAPGEAPDAAAPPTTSPNPQ